MTIAKIKKCDIIEKLIIRYRKECLNKMSVKVEKTENTNEVKLSFEIEAEKFDEAMKKVYAKTAKYFNIPGFRKGKAPMQMVEKQYGSSIFYEDTFNELVPEGDSNSTLGAYKKAVTVVTGDNEDEGWI